MKNFHGHIGNTFAESDQNLICCEIENIGTSPIAFTSVLELHRPDKRERPTEKYKPLAPGQRKFFYHIYYTVDSLDGGKIKTRYYYGDKMSIHKH